MSARYKIVIAAGGTGGHLYPGLALARELAGRSCEPLFFIRRNDPAKDILVKENLPFYEIPVAGMPRKLSLRFIPFFFLLAQGLVSSALLLRKIKPSAVVGMGGYISFPAVLAAALQRIPTIIHEQNYLPGFANKTLARVAGAVAVSFEGAAASFPGGKTVLTGNPVRSELFNVAPEEAYRFFHLRQDIFTVLVFGGSLGAARINRTMLNALELLKPLRDKLQFIHVTGKNDHAPAAEEYSKQGFRAAVFPYLHEIQYAYAAADLVICRAGATTVAELTLLRKHALFIPFPHATANHQEYNVRDLVTQGDATMIREKDLIPLSLSNEITSRHGSYKGHASPRPLPESLPQQKLADLVLKSII